VARRLLATAQKTGSEYGRRGPDIPINVSEDIRSLGKGFLTIGGIKHQWLVSGNKIEAVIHSGTNPGMMFDLGAKRSKYPVSRPAIWSKR